MAKILVLNAKKELKVMILTFLSRELEKFGIEHEAEELKNHGKVALGLGQTLFQDPLNHEKVIDWYDKIFTSPVLKQGYSKSILNNVRRSVQEDFCGIPLISKLRIPALRAAQDAINVDLVLAADAKSTDIKKITDNAIRSAGKMVNLIVVESNKSIKHDHAHTIHPDAPFNYNAYLNLGAKQGNADYFFGNNDLIFYKNWETNLIAEFKRHNIVSAPSAIPSPEGGCNLNCSHSTTNRKG